MATDVSFSQAQAASFGVGLVRLRLGKRGAGDDGGRGVGRTDVAWKREEVNARALVTKDPRVPARSPGRRIMMTSARDWVSRP
jgi:hypothetical protein